MTGKRRDDAADTATDPPGAARVSGESHPLDDAAVAAYLREHPDFLRRHPDLLDVLQAPRRDYGDGVVDLQKAMMERLRGELARLRESRDDLIQTGRVNMNTQTRIHESVLALLRAKSFEHLIETVTTDLVVMLDLDAITICVEQAPEGRTGAVRRGVLQTEPGAVDQLLGDERDHLLIAELAGANQIFGEAAALIQSAALLRLEIPGAPAAMLALGSRTPGHFEPNQGTEFLRFLANVLALTIRRWLELPA
jgi:uncharacterized protein YigA (DUF484 family)